MSTITYNSLLLLPESKELLKRKYPGVHPNYYGDHCTLEFRPKFAPDIIGEKVIITAVGYKKTESAEALIVSLNTINSKNDVPHITISTAHGVGPGHSNRMLEDLTYESITHFTLGTIVSSCVGKQHITDPTYFNN